MEIFHNLILRLSIVKFWGSIVCFLQLNGYIDYRLHLNLNWKLWNTVITLYVLIFDKRTRPKSQYKEDSNQEQNLTLNFKHFEALYFINPVDRLKKFYKNLLIYTYNMYRVCTFNQLLVLRLYVKNLQIQTTNNQLDFFFDFSKLEEVKRKFLFLGKFYFVNL